MYKKVKQYAAEKNLTVVEKKGLVYGRINGFFVVIEQEAKQDNCHIVRIWAKRGDMQPTMSIVDYTEQCSRKYSCIKEASYDGSQIVALFQGQGRNWSREYIPGMDGFLEEITAFCRDNGMIQACEACGTEYDLSLYHVDSDAHMLCENCKTSLQGRLKEVIPHEATSGNGNVVGGIIGAVLGAMLGVAVWIIIGLNGYISAIAGFVMIFCAFKGYKLFGGKLNKTGIFLCCLISIVMVPFAELLCMTLEIYRVYGEYYTITLLDAWLEVPELLKESEIKSAFIYDLVIGYPLMALGAWSSIQQALGNSRRKIVNTETEQITRI